LILKTAVLQSHICSSSCCCLGQFWHTRYGICSSMLQICLSKHQPTSQTLMFWNILRHKY